MVCRFVGGGYSTGTFFSLSVSGASTCIHVYSVAVVWGFLRMYDRTD